MRHGRRHESSYLPRFLRISSVEGVLKKRIFRNRVRPSVRPEAHSSRIGRFRLTKNSEILFLTVLAAKSLDFTPQKGVQTKKTLPPVKTFIFFVICCEFHSQIDRF